MTRKSQRDLINPELPQMLTWMKWDVKLVSVGSNEVFDLLESSAMKTALIFQRVDDSEGKIVSECTKQIGDFLSHSFLQHCGF